jgi:hypothetical protein
LDYQYDGLSSLGKNRGIFGKKVPRRIFGLKKKKAVGS